MHDKHLVVGGASTTPNTIYYSGTNDIDDFNNTNFHKIQKGSIQNLGRPTIHPKDVAIRFKNFLKN